MQPLCIAGLLKRLSASLPRNERRGLTAGDFLRTELLELVVEANGFVKPPLAAEQPTKGDERLSTRRRRGRCGQPPVGGDGCNGVSVLQLRRGQQLG